jgi:hypothetical protein
VTLRRVVQGSRRETDREATPIEKKVTALNEEGIEKDLEFEPLEPPDISKASGWSVSCGYAIALEEKILCTTTSGVRMDTI